MKIVAWIVLAIAGVAIAPFLIAALLVAGVCVGGFRLFRWVELVALFDGDETKRDKAHWRYS